ncbi:MAG: hypothetical protein M3Y77_15855 [Actinomycetota bacterium]|nr:hypothetical protein [Actinomycetota bacterium]
MPATDDRDRPPPTADPPWWTSAGRPAAELVLANCADAGAPSEVLRPWESRVHRFPAPPQR